MSDRIRNLGSLDPQLKDGNEAPFGWTSRRAGATEEDRLLADLKSVATLSKEKWLRLARLYKNSLEFGRAEFAYVGARYCDITDRDLMREWAGVFQLNRAHEYTHDQMLDELNVHNQGLIDVINGPHERLMRELQHLLWTLERREIQERGEKLR